MTSALLIDGPDEIIRNHIDKIDSLNLLLQTYPNINLDSKTYPNECHLSMFMYSVIDGLTSIFDGYNYGFIKLNHTVTLDTYQEHYKDLSQRLGFEFTLPLNKVRRVAYVNYHQQNWQNAIDAYNACYSKYENDIDVHQEMAICYKNLENEKKSKYYYSIMKELESK